MLRHAQPAPAAQERGLGGSAMAQKAPGLSLELAQGSGVVKGTCLTQPVACGVNRKGQKEQEARGLRRPSKKQSLAYLSFVYVGELPRPTPKTCFPHMLHLTRTSACKTAPGCARPSPAPQLRLLSWAPSNWPACTCQLQHLLIFLWELLTVVDGEGGGLSFPLMDFFRFGTGPNFKPNQILNQWKIRLFPNRLIFSNLSLLEQICFLPKAIHECSSSLSFRGGGEEVFSRLHKQITTDLVFQTTQIYKFTLSPFWRLQVQDQGI